jgi:hypothetical protein
MASETSVVTPERFASGLTYAEYIGQIKVNKNWFQQLYDDFQLSPEDVRYFSEVAGRPDGPAKMLVLGEDWCPDVYRGMPVMARIAEASSMEMRVFARDSNMDIMNEFLKEGQWASIPTAVFYTREHGYLCHWIERPAEADREMEEIASQVKADMPDAEDVQIRAAARPRNQERYPAWQRETVREIREMLGSRLGL